MELERDQLQKDIHALYAREHAEMGEAGTYERLDRAKQWDLAPILNKGGVLLFPHAGVLECGHQIAACVNAVLDSGADRCVVVSVLHAFTDKMQDARVRVANGEDPANFDLWGIQGPGLEFRNEWTGDHALISFRHFMAAETKRRGIKGPEVIERYPYLAGKNPELLPNMRELEEISKDAVIVTTADAFHHGIGYGDAPENAYYPHKGGLDRAHASILEGCRLLQEGDYWGYNGHCVTAKSDARDAGQVITHLRGRMKGSIVDLTYSEAGALYKTPDPTWVAAALVTYEPV
ncbi:MAG: hypothetical protein ACPG8W_18055 [Candidatus Promineifilaceae bacterium]